MKMWNYYNKLCAFRLILQLLEFSIIIIALNSKSSKIEIFFHYLRNNIE